MVKLNYISDTFPWIIRLIETENKDIVFSLFDQFKVKKKINNIEDIISLIDTPTLTTDEINQQESDIRLLIKVEAILSNKMSLLGIKLPNTKKEKINIINELNRNNITVYLSIFVTILLTVFIIILLFVNIPQNNKDLVTQLMLTLVGGWAGMMSYYFASTADSKDKDARLEKKKKNILDKK